MEKRFQFLDKYIFCYNQADVAESQRNANAAVRSSALSVMNAIGGTQIGTHANMAQAERALEKVVDFSKCPKCNSRSIRKLNKEEWEKEKVAQASANAISDKVISSADEIKKFKELLDMGIITQEEFDAKKKQLLGL